jgi:hypothetical protein
MPQVEIFTATGVISGVMPFAPLGRDGPDLRAPLIVDSARVFPLDGEAPVRRGTVMIAPDDVLIVVTPQPDVKVHMTWYEVTLEMGPYHATGRLATHPGFDPTRALVRPGSTFVPLSDLRIELIGRPEAGVAEREYVHVNRYAVERATSSLMLGFFFPGARLSASESVPVA